ncbi:uncharacterized protein SPPG_08100 [Spizellomyces punctatus DAOM BR117]|uniref:Uncharacterized protein n=1 Tax=Spizellomyces punctatus (strain DAOM BR117) TaxID=645134 RepID=A0A0L0H6G9_SPIPD|nr:uncharacterized protein SPPG_08100 [Spizellomyces punctatus DAOM BR117]KNC96511.1 hypothetical protein SPPG_08100 [Spizellomyces punctatus DAOM BR117]|eukprot:XP_016604551.1 hypothetical protein SPPG_08100 [Spizellomyces punctatus DAOM BR117]
MEADVGAPSQHRVSTEIPTQPHSRVASSDKGEADGVPDTEGQAEPSAEGPVLPPKSVENELLEKNEDYQLLLSTLTVLRNQLTQAEEDLTKLINMKEEALQDPLSFVEKLMSKNLDTIPKPQRVVAVPHIDLYKYQGDTGSTSTRFPRTRSYFRSDIFDRSFSPGWGTPLPDLGPVDDSEISSSHEMETEQENSKGTPEERSHTFNQPWSEEEHTRLMELLEVYPEESIATRRFEKISAALGSRTSRQVASRVQKLFEPRSRTSSVKKASTAKPTTTRVSGTYYSNRFSGSRYLHTPTVTMSDDEGDDEDIGIPVHPELKSSEEYKELLRLQKLAKLKANVPSAHTADPVHYGYSCDRCLAEPIVGTRWKCLDCPEESQVDLCDECMDKNFQNDHHSADHRFEKIATPEETDMQDDYAYLGFRKVE